MVEPIQLNRQPVNNINVLRSNVYAKSPPALCHCFSDAGRLCGVTVSLICQAVLTAVV